MKNEIDDESNFIFYYNLIVGIIFIVLGIYSNVNRDGAARSLAVTLAAMVMLAGFLRIANGILVQPFTSAMKVINIVVGFLLLFLGTVIVVETDLSDTIVNIYLAFSLLLLASSRIPVIFSRRKIPINIRFIVIIIAAVQGLMAMYIILIPDTDNETSFLILSLGFLFLGIGRIITALTVYR